MNTIHPHRLLLLLAGGLLLLLPSVASAQAPSCPALFKQKAFLKAAKCFEAKANAMGKTSRLSKIQRYLKGQALRNAALAYKNSAKGVKNIEVAAYRRSLALKILRRYLAENLCQRAYLCKLAKGETLELINLIKYTQLSVVTTPGKRAFVKITGYKFKAEHISPPQWNKKVRPGRYKIVVRYEGGKSMPREVLAPPGQSVTVTMLLKVKIPRRLPPKRPLPVAAPKAPVYTWIIAGVGGAAALAGGALLIVAQLNVSERDRLAQQVRDQASGSTPAARATLAKSSGYNNSKQAIERAHNTAASMLLPGWILVGAGSAVLVTGIVLAVVLKPKAKPLPPTDGKANTLLRTF